MDPLVKNVLLWLATTVAVVGGSATLCYLLFVGLTMLWLRPLAEAVLVMAAVSEPCP